MVAGVKVMLPVFERGALLFIGDGHARQGHAEVVGTGLETSMDVEFTVDLVKRQVARLQAAPGLAARRPDLTIDAELGDASPPEWSGDLDVVLMRGNRITTEAVFFHRASGTVLFTDLLQQFPPGWFRGWRALAARLDLMTEPEPAVPRKFRVAFTDRKAARAALARVLEWPAEKVVMAHGRPVERNGRAFVARAFRWLAKR